MIKIYVIMRERRPAPYSNEEFPPFWEIESLHRSLDGCAKFFADRVALLDSLDRHHEYQLGPGDIDAQSLVIGREYSVYRRRKDVAAENFVPHTLGDRDTFRVDEVELND